MDFTSLPINPFTSRYYLCQKDTDSVNTYSCQEFSSFLEADTYHTTSGKGHISTIYNIPVFCPRILDNVILQAHLRRLFVKSRIISL